jgi:hypothetical protein
MGKIVVDARATGLNPLDSHQIFMRDAETTDLNPLDGRRIFMREIVIDIETTGLDSLVCLGVEPAAQRSRRSHDHWPVAVVDSVDQRPVERVAHALQVSFQVVFVRERRHGAPGVNHDKKGLGGHEMSLRGERTPGQGLTDVRPVNVSHRNQLRSEARWPPPNSRNAFAVAIPILLRLSQPCVRSSFIPRQPGSTR